MTSGIELTVGALREPLMQAGFRKRSGGTFTISLADGVLGWLGLNSVSRHRPRGQIAIHPIIGVRHQAVERLIAGVLQETFRNYQPPTIVTPVGYVMPEHRDKIWEFGGQHGTTAAPEVIEAIVDYGMPFMRSHTHLSAILEAANEGLCRCSEYCVPAILEVMGRHDDAKTAVARAVDGLGDRQDAAAQKLHHFAAAFGAAEGGGPEKR
jgi:hypothetical protein